MTNNDRPDPRVALFERAARAMNTLAALVQNAERVEFQRQCEADAAAFAELAELAARSAVDWRNTPSVRLARALMLSEPSREHLDAVCDAVAERRMGDAPIFYCGCLDVPGHYVSSVPPIGEGDPDPRPASLRGYRLDHAERWGTLYAPEHVRKVTHVEGWTVLSMCDYTVDKRPNSHITFAMEGTLSVSEAEARARIAYPSIWKRVDDRATPRRAGEPPPRGSDAHDPRGGSMNAHWTDQLVALGACADAVAWARTQPDPETAWRECPRGDWMLWIAGKYAGDPGSAARKPLVLAACACARLAYPDGPATAARITDCLTIAERWAHGTATLAEVRSAAYAAYFASDVASAASAASAAYATAAHAYAASAASAESDRRAVLRTCAEIVRQHYPTPPEPTPMTRPPAGYFEYC